MATIKDIAERVGVSTCTVSRYINGKIVVREETARKIDQAIQDLDYHKNYMAVSLKTRQSKLIALVFPSLKNIFFAEIADSIASTLGRQGYSMITLTTENDFEKERQVCDKLLEMGVAGTIFMTLPFNYQDDAHLRRLEKHNIATVMINRVFAPGEFPSVATDFRTGVEETTRLLLGKGRRSIGSIVGANQHPQSDAYRETFLRVMREEGVPKELYHVRNCHFDALEMEKATEELLDLGVDVLFGISDFTILSALKVIEKRKLKIPGDVMLVGSGNTQFSELARFTSLDSRANELGEKGAQMMLGMLEGMKPDSFILVEPAVVERDSTR